MIDEVKAHVVIGNDAEEFVASDLGRALLGMASQDEAEAVSAIADADPSNASQMMALQVKLKVARAVPQYLKELIDRGREIFAAYKQQKES